MAKSDVGPLIGALFRSVSPKAGDSKRAGKPKTPKFGRHRVTKGERTLVSHEQQHGELASSALPREHMPTAHQMAKQHARSAKHNATESWISGHMSTKDHSAVHARADHVLRGKNPGEFKGKSGERAFRPSKVR